MNVISYLSYPAFIYRSVFCSMDVYTIDLKVEFGWKELLRYASEIVEAIHALHHNTPQIVHRDIKSMNFLVSKSILDIITTQYY